jgi:hypothetical protein
LIGGKLVEGAGILDGNEAPRPEAEEPHSRTNRWHGLSGTETSWPIGHGYAVKRWAR